MPTAQVMGAACASWHSFQDTEYPYEKKHTLNPRARPGPSFSKDVSIFFRKPETMPIQVIHVQAVTQKTFGKLEPPPFSIE